MDDEPGQPCEGGCGIRVAFAGKPGYYKTRRYVLESYFRPEEPRRRVTCSERCASLARRVKHDPRACDVCGEPFTPKRSDARYCSSACRQDAYRKRKLGATT